MTPLQTILEMPLGEDRGRPRDRLYGPEGRVLPAPWLADEFPEFAGEALPPPLDYLCDDEAVWPLVRERWRGRFAGSLLWRAARLALLALTAAGLLMLVWPDSRLRQAALMSLVVVWAPLGAAVAVEYVRLWGHRAKWRQPRLLLYPTDRHMLHEICMTPLQPRDLLLAQWLRTAAPRPSNPPHGWQAGGVVPRAWGKAAAMYGALLAVVFLFAMWGSRRPDIAARLAVLIVWQGGAALWLLQRAFAGASLIWIFPIPPVPSGEDVEYSWRWWRERLGQWWNDFVRSVQHLWISFVVSLPFASLFLFFFLVSLLTWRSPAFFAMSGVSGVIFLLLSRSPLIVLGQRYARWMAREAVADFERRALRLRARQLALFDANKPLPRPR